MGVHISKRRRSCRSVEKAITRMCVGEKTSSIEHAKQKPAANSLRRKHIMSRVISVAAI